MNDAATASPQIDFYVSPGTTHEQRLLLACRLADKAFRSGHRVYIHCRDAAQAQQLDTMLWSFQATSFVPHALVGSDDTPVQIGHASTTWNIDDVLINLDHTIPENFAQFRRVLEVVVQEQSVLDNTRDHFRQYRQLGHNPQRRELPNA
ncbi:MAG: DNA polymerase III subunit chi [Thauera sp.]|jgi:DNA polymerase-3 subunit chi|nr:DNA polymerase III subunit chi [Thauera sp.]